MLRVLRDMKLAKGDNTLLWPGAKRDKFDEQLPRNKTSVFRPFWIATPFVDHFVGCVADIVASRAAVPRNVCVMDDVRHRAPNAQGSW